MPTEQAPMPTKLGSLSLRAHFCRLRPTVVVPLSFIRSAANSRSWHVPLVRGSDVLIGCHLQTDSGVSYNAKHYPAGGTLKPVLTVAVYVCVVPWRCTCVCVWGGASCDRYLHERQSFAFRKRKQKVFFLTEANYFGSKDSRLFVLPFF